MCDCNDLELLCLASHLEKEEERIKQEAGTIHVDQQLNAQVASYDRHHIMKMNRAHIPRKEKKVLDRFPPRNFRPFHSPSNETPLISHPA